jgi:phage gp46-like protein
VPITTRGSDIALALDPRTGRYTFDWASDGNPRFTDSEEYAVLSALHMRLGQWWADTQGNIGSRLYTVTTEQVGTTEQIKAFAFEALQPMVEEGRLRSGAALRANCLRLGPGRYHLAVFYVTVAGRDGSVTLALPLEYP